MRKLRAYKLAEMNAFPFIFYNEILAYGQCLNAFSQALDEIARTGRSGLPRDCLHDGKHVLSAVVDLAHEKIDLLFMPLPLCNIRHKDKPRQSHGQHWLQRRPY